MCLALNYETEQRTVQARFSTVLKMWGGGGVRWGGGRPSGGIMAGKRSWTPHHLSCQSFSDSSSPSCALVFRSISIGSPQGTVLSPILFTLYTNVCTVTDTTIIIKYSDESAMEDLSIQILFILLKLKGSVTGAGKRNQRKC